MSTPGRDVFWVVSHIFVGGMGSERVGVALQTRVPPFILAG